MALIFAAKDRYSSLVIGGTEVVQYLENPELVHTPDTLSRTFSLNIKELEQFTDGGNAIHVGAAVVAKAKREGRLGDEFIVFRGIVVDKFVIEQGGVAWLEINCADYMYRLSRTGVEFSTTSQTTSKELFLFFKDDGSGAGVPTRYVRKCELRIYDPVLASYYIPREDMDSLPLTSLRRKKTDEPSVYSAPGEYDLAFSRKELLFHAAQVDKDDPTKALPNKYVTGVPNPPATTNEDWEYKARAIFFVNPLYPTRNTDENCSERILRNRVFTGFPLDAVGGSGFSSAQLNLTFSYTKGVTLYIPDRAGEGMRVTAAVSGSNVTVSDGGAWTPLQTITYEDVQGIERSYTVNSIAGNVLTLSSAPVGLVKDMRVYGCQQPACIINITGGDTTEEMNNYTDIVIGGTTYFIREIRSTTQLVIVRHDEDDDFSGLGASGTLTYPTLEYTGLQVRRLNWDKKRGTCADLLQYMVDQSMLPINYRVWYDPRLDVVRGRLIRQYRDETIGASASGGGNTTVTVSNVDGFYPGKQLAFWAGGQWNFYTINAVDYANETITVTGVVVIADGTTLYANCKRIYRHQSAEHSMTLEDLFQRIELESTANQAYPLLSASTPMVAPYNPQAAPGSWTILGDTDDMVDNTPTTYWNLYRSWTGAGTVDGDPEQWGLVNNDGTGLPWIVGEWDLGEDVDVEELLLQIGYPGEELNNSFNGVMVYERPAFTVMVRSDGADPENYAPCAETLVAREFDPLNPNQGSLVHKCNLLKRFRYIRLCCDRPFFYKVKENSFGTPTRRRDIPVLMFQAYKRPIIRYTNTDEEQNQTKGAPEGQITPYLENRPFVQLTDKGGTISNIAALVLTIGAHNFQIGDKVMFWDTSAGAPFTTGAEVTAIGATTITVDATPGGLANGDEVGDIRRWMLDVLDEWRDLYTPYTVADRFEHISPMTLLEDEGAQDGFDAQRIAVSRMWDYLITVRDGTAGCLFDPTIELYDQVVSSLIFSPELVFGINFTEFQQSFALRQFNVTIEEESAP